MRFITYTLAAIVAVGAPLAIAQVSGVDTTRSLEDRAAFPDPTLPQEDKYIPEVRKKVTNPLTLEDEAEAENEGPTAEEVADFIGIEPAKDKGGEGMSNVSAETSASLSDEEMNHAAQENPAFVAQPGAATNAIGE